VVVNDSRRDIEAPPAGDSPPQPEFGVVGVGKEIFVKTADFGEHGAAVKRGAAIGPGGFLEAIVLAAVGLSGAAAAILAVGVNQMSGFVDNSAVLPSKNFRGRHAYFGIAFDSRQQLFEPAWFGLGVVVEQADELALGGLDALVVGGAKSAIPRILDGSDVLKRLLAKQVERAVGRAVVDDDNLEIPKCLLLQAEQAGPQQVMAIPVDDDDRDGWDGHRYPN
jgi:hypothetical protein